MNSFRSTLALTLALSTGLAAQGQTADRSKTFNYGDSEWGGTTRFAGHAAFSTAQRTPILRDLIADLGAEVLDHVNLAGHRVEAFYERGDLDVTLGAGFSLQGITYSPAIAMAMTERIGGFTIYRRESDQITTTTFNPSTQNLVVGRGFQELVQVGPVTVTLYANGVADIDLTLRPRLALVPPSVGLQLDGRGEVNGAFGTSIDVLGFAVGVDGLVDLADPKGDIEVHTTFVTVGGSVGWSVDSIHLFLQVFARAFGLEWRTTILNNDFAGTKGSIPFEI